MAGTLTIATLSDGTNSTSSTNCIKGSARAWVNWTVGNPGTINQSFNVSSVTYSSTGAYVVNFTTAMPNTGYATSLGIRWLGGNGNLIGENTNVARTTSSVGISTFSTGGAYADATAINVAIFSS